MLRWLSWPYWERRSSATLRSTCSPGVTDYALRAEARISVSNIITHSATFPAHQQHCTGATAVNLEPQSWPDGCLLFVAPKQSSAAGCFQQLSEELSNSCWGSPHANKSLDELILPQLQPSVLLSSPPSDNPQAWWFGDSLLYFVASSSSQVNVRAVARDRRSKTRWETEHSSQHRSRWKTKTVGGFQLAQRSTCVPLHLVRCWVPLCPWLAFTVNK